MGLRQRLTFLFSSLPPLCLVTASAFSHTFNQAEHRGLIVFSACTTDAALKIRRTKTDAARRTRCLRGRPGSSRALLERDAVLAPIKERRCPRRRVRRHLAKLSRAYRFFFQASRNMELATSLVIAVEQWSRSKSAYPKYRVKIANCGHGLVSRALPDHGAKLLRANCCR
jgi:hypothetical protein